MAHPRAGVIVAVIVSASLGGWWLGTTRAGNHSSAVVTRAVDGDTIQVTIGSSRETIRLLGIDTPEITHPEAPDGKQGRDECFGPEATAFTAANLVGRAVTLELDEVHRDRYGRLLAFVIVDGARFNDQLLAEGLARLLVIPPNGRHARSMLETELAARKARRGIWGQCEPD